MSKHQEPDWKHPVDMRKVEANFQKESRRRQMQKVKKQLKSNHQPKVRRKDWRLDSFSDLDELEDVDFTLDERIMPRGERERRQSLLKTALAKVTEELDQAEKSPPVTVKPGLRGTVVEVSSGLCRVELAGRSLICEVRSSLSATDTGFTNVVAVGDEVIIFDNGSGRGLIEQVLPRRTVLARPDVFYPHRQQVIVANADQLLIVAAWRSPTLWLELVDRYLISAERSRLRPIICLNKIDLAEDTAAYQAAMQPYRALGYPVIFTSALTGEGVDTLRESLRGQITALAGLSGVGKSSLLAVIQPGLQLRTGAVSEQSGEGRHTTTQVTMLSLAGSGFVVDTPGIREFGLSGLSRRELINFYPDLAVVATRCRFADCAHHREPGCAVKLAVAQGELATSRYETYRKIYETLPA